MMRNVIKEIPEGYKESALGIIPVDWEVDKISKIGKITSGTTPLRSDDRYHTNTTIHWVKTSDLNNSVITQTEEKVSDIALLETSLRIYPKGTVLVAMYGGFNQIGRTGILGIEATINQALSAIAVYGNIVHPLFLQYWLNAKVAFWKNLAGSSRKDPNITSKDVGDFPIVIIPLAEQISIIRTVKCFDETIEILLKLISKKEFQKKALMQLLLTGKKRIKGFERKWSSIRLQDIFERVTRKNIKNSSNVVTISAQRGFVKQEDFFNKTIASDTLTHYFLVKHGEFCYNKSYSNGYPWGATKRLNSFDEAVVTTLYICFKLISQNDNSGDFFEHYFESGALEKGLMKIAHEGGRAHGLLNVTPADFFNLTINIPDFEEQTAIANILQTADKEIQLLKAKAEKLKEQKRGMMQQLLTGKKRLKPIEI